VHFGGPHDLESLADALGFPQPRSVIDLPPEPWAAERTRVHPAPYLIAGDPPLIGLQTLSQSVLIGPVRYSWLGGVYYPWPVLQDARAVPIFLEQDALLEELTRLTKQLLRSRRREFRRCDHCGETLPNEQMMERGFDPGVNVCHGCAQEKYGVVF
jgi:hypothetical protein